MIIGGKFGYGMSLTLTYQAMKEYIKEHPKMYTNYELTKNDTQ